MSPTSRLLRTVAALSTVSLLAVGCSDDAGDSNTTEVSGSTGAQLSPSSTSEAPTTTPPAATPTAQDVAQQALDRGTAHYTLVAATDGGATLDELLATATGGAVAGGSTSTTSVTTSVAGSVTGDSTASGGGELQGDVEMSDGRRSITFTGADAAGGEVTAVVDDGTLNLRSGAGDSWGSIPVDESVTALDIDALLALHDPSAVLRAIAQGGGEDTASSGSISSTTADTGLGANAGTTTTAAGDAGPSTTSSATTGAGAAPGGTDITTTVSTGDVDDPYVAALAALSGSAEMTVHLIVTPDGMLQAMGYDFAGGQAGQAGGGVASTSTSTVAPSDTTATGGVNTDDTGASQSTTSSPAGGADTTVASGTGSGTSTGETTPVVAVVVLQSFGETEPIASPSGDTTELTPEDVRAAVSVDLMGEGSAAD